MVVSQQAPAPAAVYAWPVAEPPHVRVVAPPPPPLLSVVIPCYNERGTILALLDDVRRVDLAKEIIVVDDGSTDGTREILADLDGSYPEVRVIFQERNLSLIHI